MPCTCPERLNGDDAILVLHPSGQVLAAYSKACPEHGVSRVSEVDLPADELKRRIDAGEFAHIQVIHRRPHR